MEAILTRFQAFEIKRPTLNPVDIIKTHLNHENLAPGIETNLFFPDDRIFESFKHFQNFVNRYGWVRRMVVDTLEIGVCLIFNILGKLLVHGGEDAGHIARLCCNIWTPFYYSNVRTGWQGNK